MFLLNLNGNYQSNEEFYEASPGFTIFFDIIFIIMTNYILGIMFLIFVVHVTSDYYKNKENEN